MVVTPGVLHDAYRFVFVCVGLYGGWVWLHCSGIGLVLLWCAAHDFWRREEFVLHLVPAADAVGAVEAVAADRGARAVRLDPWRITFVIGGGRREVFADEVSAREWAALRRSLREQWQEG